MMWRVLGSGVLASLLAVVMAGIAVAQDEDLRMGDDPAYSQRVEVPEAGVAISFPPDWDVEVELEYDENVPGDPETGFWRVLYAYSGDEGWCELTRNLHPVGELGGLATVVADNLVEAYGGPTTSQTSAVELAAGDAWLVDVRGPESAGFVAAYLVDAPPDHLDEPSRFTLLCQSDVRVPGDWLDVADSLEWLDGSFDDESDVERLADDDLTDADAHGLERVEFVEAGVSLALPPDWSVELILEEREDALPDAFAEAGPITFWALLHAEAPDGEWCELQSHPFNPMPLHDHASWDLAQWSAAFPDVAIDLYSAQDQGRERYIVVVRGEDDADQGANLYFFESGGERYQLNCTGVFGPDSPWDAIAASVEPLTEEVDPTADVSEDDVQHSELDALTRWIELPRAGVAMTLPQTWQAIPQDVASSVALGPPDADGPEVTVWLTLEASLEDRSCRVYAYDDMPLTLDKHAEWLTSRVRSAQMAAGPGPAGPLEVEQVESVEQVEPVELPIGHAVRLITSSRFEGYRDVIYLFEVDGQRRVLACGGPSLPSKAWLTTARTVQPLDGLPAGTVATNELRGIETQLPVSDMDSEAYMHALCERALWMEFADDTFEERLTCRLTDEPVTPGYPQGTLPDEWTSLAGGPCEWVSDFWASTDGSEVWASSWSVTLEPDGNATAISRYAADELVCDG